ncbi:MAG: hypothetical protein AAF902_13115 [Chloroflexota bacterium]
MDRETMINLAIALIAAIVLVRAGFSPTELLAQLFEFLTGG